MREALETSSGCCRITPEGKGLADLLFRRETQFGRLLRTLDERRAEWVILAQRLVREGWTPSHAEMIASRVFGRAEDFRAPWSEGAMGRLRAASGPNFMLLLERIRPASKVSGEPDLNRLLRAILAGDHALKLLLLPYTDEHDPVSGKGLRALCLRAFQMRQDVAQWARLMILLGATREGVARAILGLPDEADAAKEPPAGLFRERVLYAWISDCFKTWGDLVDVVAPALPETEVMDLLALV